MTETPESLRPLSLPEIAAAAPSGPGESHPGAIPPVSRRRLRLRTVLASGALATALWFVPPVYKLRSGPIVVTRYTKTFGETKATVGPSLPGWITTKAVSHHVLHAIVAAEDGRFYEHRGFDLAAIKKSYEVNVKRKRYARGASTISQQVVKMAFLGREKTMLRKAREAVGTMLMEAILTKDQILEWYINLAEFGDGVYGIKDGCWHYFHTKPELLTIDQSIHLALVLPSPNAWSRGLRLRHLTAFGHRRFAAILRTMRGMGYVTPTQWASTLRIGDFGRPIAGSSALLSGTSDDGEDDSVYCSTKGACDSDAGASPSLPEPSPSGGDEIEAGEPKDSGDGLDPSAAAKGATAP